MKKLAISAVALAMAATASTALANEFSGLRIQAQAMHDRVETIETEVGVGDLIDFDDDSNDSYGFGGGVGYDFALNSKIIAGVEANINFAKTEDSGFEGFIGNGIHGDDMKMDREVDLSARLGYIVAPRVLVYGKIGYAVSRMAFEVEGYELGQDRYDTETDLGDQKRSRGGLLVGVGAEMNLTKNVFAKAEYRYSQYSAWNTQQDFYDYGAANTFVATYKFKREQVGVALGYRF